MIKLSAYPEATAARDFVEQGATAMPWWTKEPDAETAQKINEKCFHKGLLMFAPVGIAGECIKIAPPLVITREALEEGIRVLEDACDEVLINH